MVKKQTLEDSQVNDYRSSITFVVYPAAVEDSCELVVELTAANPTDSIIRVVDEKGNTLFEEAYYFSESGSQTYTIRDLQPGTYFFEISDNFFHQVKEIHLLN